MATERNSLTSQCLLERIRAFNLLLPAVPADTLCHDAENLHDPLRCIKKRAVYPAGRIQDAPEATQKHVECPEV